MEIGDKVRVDGMTGVVVALPAEGKFAPDHPAEAWAFLEVGALVDTVEAGLIHYPSLDRLEIDREAR
jgi:hypothetical protein